VTGPLKVNTQSTQPKLTAPKEEPYLAPVPTKGGDVPDTTAFIEEEEEPEVEEDWGGGGAGSMVSPADGTAGMGDPLALEPEEEELLESTEAALVAAGPPPVPFWKRPKILAGAAFLLVVGLYMNREPTNPGFPEEY